MTPLSRFPLPSLDDNDHHHQYQQQDMDILTEALEITPSSSPLCSPSHFLTTTTHEEPDGKAWQVFTETEPMLPHPHLQLSLIRSSLCQSNSSGSSSNGSKTSSAGSCSADSPSSPLAAQPSDNTLDHQHLQRTHDDDDDDDQESVGYFEIDDFNSSYWIKAVSNVPTLSLAAILTTGFAILHPWMFVVGALTAVGTAHAYGWMTPTTETTTTFSDSASFATSQQAVPDKTTTLQQETAAATTTTLPSPTTELFCRSFSPGNMTNDALIPTDRWLRKYFPAMEMNILSHQEFPGLSALEFFQVFFADDAPYNFKEFQKKRGDADICYGLWSDTTTTPSTTTTTTTAPQLPHALSFVSHAHLLDGEDVPSVESFQQRVLTFKTMTKSLFGPPFAIATKEQVAVRRSKRCVVIESKTTLSQIPFCDRFYILERWLIQSDKQGHPSRHVAKLQVEAQVVFTTKCPFEYQIRTKSASTLSEVCNAWCAMAQEALKLTEQAKLERLQKRRQEQQQQQHDDMSCCTSASSSSPSSYAKEHEEDHPLYSYSPEETSRERDEYESTSIEVPYSQVYDRHDDYPTDSSSLCNTTKQVSLSLASPRLLLNRCKLCLWTKRRTTSTDPL